jgi:vancomycin permeability regulator SanA
MIVNPTFYFQEPVSKSHTPSQFLFKLMVIIVLLVLTPYLFTNLSLVSKPSLDIQPKVAIVFGAQTYSNLPGELLQARLDKTVSEYNKKTFTTILVSGNNFKPDFETKIMSEYLINKGVPKEAISEDGLSLRTLDTCYRARTIYSISSAYLITQSFHMARAYSLCTNQEINSVPLVAESGNISVSVTSTIREIFSSVLAVKDTVLKTKPKYTE